MSTDTPLPPAGWYPDPQGGSGQRWWNGASWSTETRAVETPAPATPVAYPHVQRTAAYPGTQQAAAYPGTQHPGSYPPGGYAGYAAAPVAAPIGAWRSQVDDRPAVASIGAAIRTVFSKYATFEGRAGRGEYWWWALFNALVVVVGYLLGVIVVAMTATTSTTNAPWGGGFAVFGGLIFGLIWLWELAILLPNLAVLVRRLRDGGFHWALIFLGLIPGGALALLIMACLPSKYP